MTVYQIVFVHYGEISYTAKTPHCELSKFAGNLEEKKMCCWSSDDWQLVPVNKYEVREITLPDWLFPAEYCRDHVAWKYTWGIGKEIIEQSEMIQRFLKPLDECRKLAAWKLIKTKTFKSTFRQNLRDQLENWLNSDDRKYDSPFSGKQWSCLCDQYTALEAKRISSNLYHN